MPSDAERESAEIPPGFKLRHTLRGHDGLIGRIAWSPDGRLLASSGFNDRTVRIWDAHAGHELQTLGGHSAQVFSVTWSPDGRFLASGSSDKTVRIWGVENWRQEIVLEGHTDGVRCVSFSHDGQLLASNSGDHSIRLWKYDTWETIAVLRETAELHVWPPGLAFHPDSHILATLGQADTVIRIWDLDSAVLLGREPETPSARYTNAKVVLVGDTGVGKSGLGLVLTGQSFVATESTHGRRVWDFDGLEVDLDGGRKELRETILWDLAGQPGYRLVHQLSLNEVAVALVVFDARSEMDPFAGVRHWDRALRQACSLQSDAAIPMHKFLVSARADRGGIGVSRERIDVIVQEYGFDGYIETSAKDGLNIEKLAWNIRESIDWDALPKVVSSSLFQHIKSSLLDEKKTGRLLSSVDDLYRTFLNTDNTLEDNEALWAQFETCIGRVETRDLIRRLRFGNLVLLQPELLDAYASAIVNEAKNEPDGLGSILELKVLDGDFRLAEEERIGAKEQEKLLLIATVEELLRHEIALRESSDRGAYLVFPSQSTRQNPELPEPEGRAVTLGFEGPVQNIYATLRNGN